MASIAPFYTIDSINYTKDQIVEMYKKIQSEHDKTKSREFTPLELAIKEHYKTIQSARDSERIRALKTTKGEIPVHYVGEFYRDSRSANSAIIRNVLAKLSESQIDFDCNPYSNEQRSRIWAHFESARSALLSLREVASETRASETVTHTIPSLVNPDDLKISGDLTIQVGDNWFNEEMILEEKAKIQSAHDKDKTLVYNVYELGILQEYRKIQSRRDSERIRARKLLSKYPISV